MAQDRTLLEAVGLVVRARRERQGLSQEAFALRVGLHRTYIGSIERGERNLGLLNLAALAKALDCTAADVLAEAEAVVAGLARTEDK